ncbi:MAG TPA: pyrimidine reductase family protein [Pseudonocardiaceae bacterium]|nr:pyrimidine reductase family protein [Pseudonocardiaceae bacterium]
MDRLLPTPAASLDDDALASLYDYPPGLDKPWVKVNFISSADGAVAVGGRSAGLSDPNDKKIFALGRTLADVVLVGAGTALIERYRGIRPNELRATRRVGLGLAPVPPIAVVSRRCTVLPESPLVTDTIVPTIVFTTETAPAERKSVLADAGAEVVAAGDDDVDLAAVLADLDRRGLRRVCCEGGPTLFGALIVAGLVDELDLSVAPLLAVGDAGRIANGPLPAEPTRLRLASALHADDMLLLRYLRG